MGAVSPARRSPRPAGSGAGGHGRCTRPAPPMHRPWPRRTGPFWTCEVVVEGAEAHVRAMAWMLALMAPDSARICRAARMSACRVPLYLMVQSILRRLDTSGVIDDDSSCLSEWSTPRRRARGPLHCGGDGRRPAQRTLLPSWSRPGHRPTDQRTTPHANTPPEEMNCDAYGRLPACRAVRTAAGSFGSSQEAIWAGSSPRVRARSKVTSSAGDWSAGSRAPETSPATATSTGRPWKR